MEILTGEIDNTDDLPEIDDSGISFNISLHEGLFLALEHLEAIRRPYNKIDDYEKIKRILKEIEAIAQPKKFGFIFNKYIIRSIKRLIELCTNPAQKFYRKNSVALFIVYIFGFCMSKLTSPMRPFHNISLSRVPAL